MLFLIPVFGFISVYYLIVSFIRREYEKFFILYFFMGIWIPFIQRAFNYLLGGNFYFFYYIWYMIPFGLVLPFSILCVLRKDLKIKVSFILPLFLIFFFLLQLFNPIKLSLLGKAYKLLTTFSFLTLFIFFMCVQLSFRKLFTFIDRYILIAILPLFLYSMMQYILGPNIIDSYWMNSVQFNSLGLPKPFLVRTFGPANSPALLSFYFSICFIISLVMYGNRGWKLLILLMISLVGIILTQVRASLVGVIAVFFSSLFFFRKDTKSYLNKILFIVIIVTIGYLLINIFGYDLNLIERIYSLISAVKGNDVSLHERLQTWRLVVELVMRNPFGYGLGSSGKYSSLHYLHYIDNGYLTIAFETGIIGILLFMIVNVYILIMSFITYWRSREYFMTKISELTFYSTLYFLVVTTFGDFTRLYTYEFIVLTQGIFLSNLKFIIKEETKLYEGN